MQDWLIYMSIDGDDNVAGERHAAEAGELESALVERVPLPLSEDDPLRLRGKRHVAHDAGNSLDVAERCDGKGVEIQRGKLAR